MPRTLVSFLGKFQRPDGGGYERVAYRFTDEAEPIESEFFGWAAWQHLQQRPDPPTRWVILGTPTSSWDCLFALFTNNLPDGLGEWSDQAAAEVAAGGVSQETLDAFSHYANSLGVPNLRLAIMPMESDAAFVALHRTLAEDTRVILDITHAFRALPALALLALGGLRWVKNIRLDDVLYGNLEGTPRGEVKDVVSLEGAARIAELAPSLARVALVDDFEEAERVCNELEIGAVQERLRLRRQGILAGMLYPAAAGRQAGDLWQALGRWPAAGTTLRSIVGDWIRRATEAARGGGGGRMEARLVRQARKFLDRRDFLRCMLQLNEANRLVLHQQLSVEGRTEFPTLCDQLEGRGGGQELVRDLMILNQLRNHAAHAEGSLRDDTVELLREPERIRGFLEKMLMRAELAVNGRPYWKVAP